MASKHSPDANAPVNRLQLEVIALDSAVSGSNLLCGTCTCGTCFTCTCFVED